MLSDLEYVLYFIQENTINCDITKLKLENSFGVCFVDKFLNSVSFGKTRRAIIFEQNIHNVPHIIEYIKYHSKHTKTIVILPHNQTKELNTLYYKNQNDIIKHLSQNKYHYAIINAKQDYLKNILQEKKPKQQSIIF